jgi:hypothetical protein
MADENIRIRLTAVDKTRSGLASVTRGLRSVTSAVFSMRTAIASLVGAGGIGLIVKQSISATDTLAKTAAKIGTTTEQLSRLQYAANLSGISVEQTNMALQRLVRRTAEAAEGTGEARGALNELGINARVFSNLDLDVYMLELADAFTNVTSEAQQLRLGFKLFDSEGAAFINVLTQGSDALAKMYEDARILGVVMSSNVARSVERTNDSFTRLGYLFRGVRDQIVGALAPAMEALVTSFTTFLTALAAQEGGIQAWAQNFAKSILETFAGFVRGMGTVLQKLIDFGNGIITVINVIGSLRDGFIEIEPISNALAINFGAAADAILEFAENIGTLPESLEGANSKGAETVSIFERIAQVIGDVVKQMPTLDQAFKGVVTGAMNSFTQGFTDAITGAKNFADAVKDMAKSVIDSLIKMLVQYYITKPLFDALTTFIGGAGAGAGGGGAGAGTRAVGGPVSAGSPYLVGENGPELFVPSAGGQIVPNGRMGGGGVTVNQNINISTGVAQTVRAEVANLMPQIAQTAKAAVAEARMRGGNYSKSLVGA